MQQKKKKGERGRKREGKINEENKRRNIQFHSTVAFECMHSKKYY